MRPSADEWLKDEESIRGYHRDLAKLTAAFHRELHPTEEVATVQAA